MRPGGGMIRSPERHRRSVAANELCGGRSGLMRHGQQVLGSSSLARAPRRAQVYGSNSPFYQAEIGAWEEGQPTDSCWVGRRFRNGSRAEPTAR
jgi:hypothetical protein